MKKQLLALSLMIVSLGMFGQSVIWQPKDANVDTTQGMRYLWAVDSNTVWSLFYDGTYTTRTINKFTRTSNGQTFISGTFLPDTNYYNPSNIVAVNDTVAFISCYSKDAGRDGIIMMTMDSGQTWMNIADTSFMFVGSNNFPDVVHFYDNMNGWCLGDPNGNTSGTGNEFEIYQTSNMGATWTRVPDANIPNPLSGEYGLTNVYTTKGTQNIWFGTTKGRVFYSTDGGLHWSVSNPGGMAAGVEGLAFRDAMNGFVWGVNTSGGATVWKRTSNGGATWTTVTMNATDVGRYDMCAIPGRAAYMSVGINVGQTAYVTSVTTDDGTTWNVLETGATNTERVLKVMMLDSAHGWGGQFSTNTPLPYGSGGVVKYIGPSIVQTCPMYANATFTTVCSGSAVTLTGSGATTYTWSANAGSVTTQTVSVSPSANSTYTVMGSVGTCTNQATVNINVNTTPTVVATAANDTICALNPASLSATGGTTYNWTGTGLVSTSGANVATNSYSVAGTYSYVVTGTTGTCSGKDTVYVTVLPCTGIATLNNELASIYPNPSKGAITINFGKALGGTKVVITDMIGNQVYTAPVYAGTQKLNVDLGAMPKGMYLITVSNHTGASSVHKLIIE